ncbi:MAG: hypothetical protein KAG53_05290 [Endozoicomonadaceae bacterium]|nr:hypothetical protein [Endozoicomonadaceae bacterium]
MGLSFMTDAPLFMASDIKLTEYSDSVGCGYKVAAAVLNVMIERGVVLPDFSDLLVGNRSRNDAILYDLR